MRFIFMFFILFSNFLIINQSTANNILDDLLAPKQQQFLPVAEAFKLDFDQQNSNLYIHVDIEPGYYLYQQKLKFSAKNTKITEPRLPEGKWIEDEFFGKTPVYFNALDLTIPLIEINTNADIKIEYQGCAEAGLCYPPETVTIPISKLIQTSNTTVTPDVKTQQTNNSNIENATDNSSLTEKLVNQSLVTNLIIFFLLGLTLAFTPCVFPMFPILSGLIAGQAKNDNTSSALTTKNAFFLSFVYVQGMAVTYAALGLVIATLGGQVQAYLQHPAILIGFSLLFIVLAMSMFGWFEIKLPNSWMSRLTQVSNQQKSGNYLGVFFMGVLSGLIASPCTTAPLSAALLYVAQTGDYFIGAITLYVLSIGMGLPLLILGTSGGKLLPKSGAWMEQVKTLFGFIMLVVPLILLERILNFDTILTLAAILSIFTAAYLYYWQSLSMSAKSKTVLWLVSFTLLFVGLNLIQNLYFTDHQVADKSVAEVPLENNNSQFIRVSNLEDLKSQIHLANSQGKMVMLDLYADWCVACKEFEHYTFSAPSVQQAFQKFVLLQADLTDTDETTMTFMKEFNIFGLPSILFFDKQGSELTEKRVTGFMDAENFAKHLQQMK